MNLWHVCKKLCVITPPSLFFQICTNVNSCFCDEGWKGEDCSLIDEDTVRETLYYDAVEGGREVYENTYYGAYYPHSATNDHTTLT